MIIYGYRHRELEQKSGLFHCPTCGRQRTFKHIRVVRYFALFFIPLFPLDILSEYVECQVCRRKFQPDILPAVGFASEPIINALVLAAPATSTNGSCLSWGIILSGIVVLFLGCAIASILTLVQIENPDNWQGFFGLMLLCPLPLLMLGCLLSAVGVGKRRRTQSITGLD